MSTRLSFFSLGVLARQQMKSLMKGLEHERYEKDASSGFIVFEKSDILVRGQYVQKINLTEKITDPFGAQFEFPLVHFLQQDFSISAQPSYLLLINSCSAAKPLMGRLAEFTDFTLSMESVSFNTDRVFKAFAKRFDNARIFAATVDDIAISADTTARIQFQSSGQLQPQARAFLRNRQMQFSALKFMFDFSGQTWRCEIKSGGIIALHGDYDPALQSSVLETMQPFL